jgi:hypothetical protein
LVEDLTELKAIQSKYEKYHIYLQGKVLLLETQIERKMLLVSQYNELFKYQMKNLKKEFDKQKKFYTEKDN